MERRSDPEPDLGRRLQRLRRQTSEVFLASENEMVANSFAIRNARPADMPTIRALVLREGLDPTQRRVENFIVAETVEAGPPRIIGCVQMREYPGARELGSLVVEPDWRGRGVGATLVRWLLAGSAGEVYLECRAELAPYYQQFGFELVDWADLLPALKLKCGLGRLLSLLPGVSSRCARPALPDQLIILLMAPPVT